MPAESKQSKTKDLSHVPCKFFKVGSCTAGASCPFAHPMSDTGAPPSKEPCAWFIKGNCKFGHKCALAHILPGQPISMDRKNKKAAQLASQAAVSATSEPGSSSVGSGMRSGSGRRGSNKAPLLSMMPGAMGGTAPTRALKGSPSAPVPTLSGSVDMSDHNPLDARLSVPLNGVATLNETPKLPLSEVLRTKQQEQSYLSNSIENAISSSAQQESRVGASALDIAQQMNSQTSPLPLNTPRRSRQVTNGTGSFGPIGSPPNNPSLSSSPHSHGLFLTHRAVSSTLPGGGMIRPRPMASPHYHSHSASHSFVEEEMEDLQSSCDREAELLPSSLTELLPPRLQTRRDGLGMAFEGFHSSGLFKDNLSSGIGHRYSHSVPAPSLLTQEKLRSIWSPDPAPYTQSGTNVQGSHRTNGSASGNATSPFSSQPGSYTGAPSVASRFNGTSTTPTSHGFISPSNASAAFLPGMHQNYRPARTNGLADGNPHSTQISQQQYHQQSSNNINFSRELSPISIHRLALNEHAPGSSLPQGLAAGYSRIHALPPVQTAFSPPCNSPPSSISTIANKSSVSNNVNSVPVNTSLDRSVAFSPPKQPTQGLETMLSRISYASAVRPSVQSGAPRKEGPLSPLSRPGAVVSNGPEDDELFVLD